MPGVMFFIQDEQGFTMGTGSCSFVPGSAERARSRSAGWKVSRAREETDIKW